MEAEDQTCRRYEAAFAAIAALDRRYYSIPSASVDERREYAARQAQLEELRIRFYAELAACQQRTFRLSRRCRFLIRKTRRFSH